MSGSQLFTVVLANLMSQSGRLNGESVERICLAIALEEIRPAQKIILCGWAYRPDSNLSIAEALMRYVAERRPDLVHKLVCQSASRDTVGDAFFSRLLIDSFCEEPGAILDVVTSDYHVVRTSEVFRRMFPCSVTIGVQGSTSRSSRLGREASEARSLTAFRETFEGVPAGDLTAIHARLACSHPFYNGDVYPKIGSLESIRQSLFLR